MRLKTSVAPPAGYGMMKRIGLSGYELLPADGLPWAAKLPAVHDDPITDSSNKIRMADLPFIVFPRRLVEAVLKTHFEPQINTDNDNKQAVLFYCRTPFVIAQTSS
jgi:hypothetical protein